MIAKRADLLPIFMQACTINKYFLRKNPDYQGFLLDNRGNYTLYSAVTQPVLFLVLITFQNACGKQQLLRLLHQELMQTMQLMMYCRLLQFYLRLYL